MKRTLTRCVAVCTVLLSTSFASAGIDIEVPNRAAVQSQLSPANETETFVLSVPAGAKLVLAAKPLKQKGTTPPALSMELRDPLDAVAGTGIEKRGGAKLKVVVQSTGLYRLTISGDGVNTGAYVLKVNWLPAKKTNRSVTFSKGAAAATFAAPPGAAVSFLAKAAKRSTALPRLTTLTGPAEFTYDAFTVPKVGDKKHKAKRIPLAGGGDYTIELLDEGTGGEASVVVSLKFKKPPKIALDFRQTTGELPDDVFGRLALPGERLEFSVDDPVFASIEGAGIIVPPGALNAPVPILIGLSPEEVTPPPGPVVTAVGPAVFFGPDGTVFSEPVTVTIPFNAAPLAGDFSTVRVYQRDTDGTVTLIPLPYVFDALLGLVSFPASHFTTFQAFAELPPLVVSGEEEFGSTPETTNDGFGDTVAIDGDTVAVGARFDARFGSQDGSVSVFVNTTGTWLPQQVLGLTPSVTGERLPTSLDVSGDVLAMGTIRYNQPQINAGIVEIMERTGTTWTSLDLVQPNTVARDLFFGRSLALDGDRLVVGADGEMVDGAASAGAVFVFTRTGNTFLQDQRLTKLPGEAVSADNFGRSVALSGDRILAGAAGGTAHVFDLVGVTWTHTATLTPEVPNVFAGFGETVALDGDIAAVGAPLDDHGGGIGANRGSVTMFRFDGDEWVREVRLVSPTPADGDRFGVGLAVVGERVIVGAPAGSPTGGSIFVHDRIGGAWPRRLTYVPGNIAVGDFFGGALAADGNTTIVGAEGADRSTPSNAGAVRVFDID